MKAISFIERLFREHIKTESRARLLLFNRFALYSDLMVKLGMAAYIGSALLLLPYPIYMYFFENQKVPVLSLYIPGIDEETDFGFWLLNSINFPITILATFAMSATDIFYALIICNIPIMARLIEDEIIQLNEIIAVTENGDLPWIHRFRNILMMHREMTM